MDIRKIINYMTPFQWFEVLAVTGFTAYFAMIDTETPWKYEAVSSVAAICGIFCVVLCAAGKKAQYYWGFANIAAYIIVSWISRLYGEVMLNALYYLPTQFLGIILWNKNYSEETEQVKGKRLKPLYAVIMLVATAIAIILYRILLIQLGGNSAWLDSTSTVISIAANALMVMRYREQWLLWIIVDAVTVVMWLRTGDNIMTAMWAVYLINAIYGYINWSKLSKKEEAAA